LRTALHKLHAMCKQYVSALFTLLQIILATTSHLVSPGSWVRWGRAPAAVLLLLRPTRWPSPYYPRVSWNWGTRCRPARDHTSILIFRLANLHASTAMIHN